MFFAYLGYKSFIRYVFCKYFFPVCVFIIILMVSFAEHVFLILMKSTYQFFLWWVILFFNLKNHSQTKWIGVSPTPPSNSPAPSGCTIGLAKGSFGFLYNILQKNLNNFFGQPNTIQLNSDTKGSVLQDCPPTPCPSDVNCKSRLSPVLLSNWLCIRSSQDFFLRFDWFARAVHRTQKHLTY